MLMTMSEVRKTGREEEEMDSFARYLVERRHAVDPNWTSWQKFLEGTKLDDEMTPITLSRIVRVQNPMSDPRSRNAANKDAVAKALGFFGWWDLARAWRGGIHVSELPDLTDEPPDRLIAITNDYEPRLVVAKKRKHR